MTRTRPPDRRQRLKIAREHIAADKTLAQYADAIGVTIPGAWLWLNRNGKDELSQLVNATRTGMRPQKALARLLLIRVSMEFYGGQARLAKALGMTKPALSNFRQRWAPDGVDSAIADLWPDDSSLPEFGPVQQNPGR